MSIEDGREVYQVQLFTDSSETPFRLRLSYEQLSILSFQVNQVLSAVSKKIDSL